MVLTLLMRLIRVDHCDDLGEGCRKLGPKEQGRDGLPGWYEVEGNRFDLRVRVASRMCACVWTIGWRGEWMDRWMCVRVRVYTSRLLYECVSGRKCTCLLTVLLRRK